MSTSYMRYLIFSLTILICTLSFWLCMQYVSIYAGIVVLFVFMLTGALLKHFANLKANQMNEIGWGLLIGGLVSTFLAILYAAYLISQLHR